MIRIRHVNSSRPFFCRTRFEFSPRFPPRPVTCFELVLVLTVSIRREMQRNSRRRQFHQRISFPFHSSSSTQLVKLHFHSSLVAYSSNFSIDLSSISSHMLPDEVHSTSSSSADFRHLLLTRHGYSSLVRND